MDDVQLFAEVLQDVNSSIVLNVAGNGLEAIEKLATLEQSPDIIFLDLNMPRMDGKECLRYIKSDPRLSSIPVIMYTTSTQSRDIEETMMSGALCFITKPSSIKELKHILSCIAESLPHQLEKALRSLSNYQSTFIVCQ
jgi:CheY-like chemotaxis protein